MAVTALRGGALANEAIAGLLFLARAFPQRLIAQREHRWLQLRREAAPADLEGQSVLILGSGEPAAAVARFAQALAMTVLGPIEASADRRALLPQAQWLVLTAAQPLDAAALALLPRGAGIINVAGAGLLDEAALLAALQNGQLAHAYLAGVAAASPLRGLPNVLFAPAGAA
jgi:phosphoglycerate dehydrogenase-like enzyme